MKNKKEETKNGSLKSRIKKFLAEHITIPLWVMLCAGAVYLLVYCRMNSNIIQYGELPTKVRIKIPKGDSKDKDSIEFERAVISLRPLDTIGNAKNELNREGDGDSASAVVVPGASIDTMKPKKDTYPEINEALMHQNPAFMVRLMLILIMVSIAGGAFPVFIHYWSRILKQHPALKTKNIQAGVFAICVVVFMVVVSKGLNGYYSPILVLENFKILFANPSLLKQVVIGTYLLIAPSIAVIFLIGYASKALLASKADAQSITLKFEELNQILKQILQVHAVIVVFSVLTSNALGASIRATFKIEDFDIYPEVVPFLYGMFYSLFLCALYIPTYMYLKSCYQEFSTGLSMNSTPEEKDKVKEMLAIVKMDGSGVLENIKLALTLLSPLLTSLLPDAFNLFK